MSKLSGLKKEDLKRDFVAKSTMYQNGTPKTKSKMITFTSTDRYIDLIEDLVKRDRLSKSELIRAAVISFSRLSKEDRERVYIEIHNT